MQFNAIATIVTTQMKISNFGIFLPYSIYGINLLAPINIHFNPIIQTVDDAKMVPLVVGDGKVNIYDVKVGTIVYFQSEVQAFSCLWEEGMQRCRYKWDRPVMTLHGRLEPQRECCTTGTIEDLSQTVRLMPSKVDPIIINSSNVRSVY